MNAATETTACPIKALARKMPTKYLRNFFAEKDIAEIQWSLTSKDGTAHFIGNVVVVEHIALCSTEEATQIGNVLRKIDFANGNVNHFFQHLAGALING
jgi:hypothetical protein